MGAWIWLAGHGGLPADRASYIQQIGDDLLPVLIDRQPGAAVRVTMRQSAPRFLRRILEKGALADALALPIEDLVTSPAPEVVSTGAEHLLVAVTSRAAVDQAVPDSAALKRVLVSNGAEGCYVYSTEPGEDGADAYARFFNPTVGISEDPATGTAAGPLAALLTRERHAPEGHVVRLRRVGISAGRACCACSWTGTGLSCPDLV